MTFDCFIENLLLEKQLSPAPKNRNFLTKENGSQKSRRQYQKTDCDAVRFLSVFPKANQQKRQKERRKLVGDF